MQQKTEKAVIVFSIQSLMDPLFQGLMYQYMRVYNEKHSGVTFHVFTEEHPEYMLKDSEVDDKRRKLKKLGIIWHPLKYRKGRFLIFKKILSIFLLFLQIRRTKKKYKADRIIGFLIMASAYCYLISKILRLKLFSFCYEPHSLYMKEFGVWSERSLKYRILRKMETLTAHAALHLTAPTIHTVKMLEDMKVNGKISRVPISVDTEKFVYSETERKRIRKEFDIPPERYLMLYLGKFGGIYYNEKEVAEFSKRLYDFDNRIFFFTISPNSSEGLRTAYSEAGLAASDFKVLDKIPYDEIEGYISACDMGMIAIPPLDSQKYRTPVKIGNYLSCGIPFLLNKGIADDDIMAEEENVGVVFEDISQKNIEKQNQKIKLFINEDREKLRKRCRDAAIKHRGIHNSVDVLHSMINDEY